MVLLRDKLITQGEKRETSTKTCNETMLRDKLRVFVSRISSPLHSHFFVIWKILEKPTVLSFHLKILLCILLIICTPVSVQRVYHNFYLVEKSLSFLVLWNFSS